MSSAHSTPKSKNPSPFLELDHKPLRIYTKFLVFITLILIFAGGMVTSTGSGLAVPDWPLSYGSLFPPMIGGVFYEHGHRMIASFVGLCTLILALWQFFKGAVKWLRLCSYAALLLVIFQGILGGITVLFFLPTPISVAHGVIAQTFLLLLIFIAYTYSAERRLRKFQTKASNNAFLKFVIFFTILIYIQLIIGAVMRHTGSGLAIGDFPRMGGYWLPQFNSDMLFNINDWRFEMGLDPVSMKQVILHFTHRVGALLIFIFTILLNVLGFKYYIKNKKVIRCILGINGMILIQIVLGISTVLTLKSPIITSLHVVTGAGILGLTMLLFLRTAPITLSRLKDELLST